MDSSLEAQVAAAFPSLQRPITKPSEEALTPTDTPGCSSGQGISSGDIGSGDKAAGHGKADNPHESDELLEASPRRTDRPRRSSEAAAPDATSGPMTGGPLRSGRRNQGSRRGNADAVRSISPQPGSQRAIPIAPSGTLVSLSDLLQAHSTEASARGQADSQNVARFLRMQMVHDINQFVKVLFEDMERQVREDTSRHSEVMQTVAESQKEIVKDIHHLKKLFEEHASNFELATDGLQTSLRGLAGEMKEGTREREGLMGRFGTAGTLSTKHLEKQETKEEEPAARVSVEEGVRTSVFFYEEDHAQGTAHLGAWTLHSELKKLVHNKLFQNLCMFVIIINGVALAVAAESDLTLAIARLTGTSPLPFYPDQVAAIVDALFLVFYTVEVIIKLYAFRTEFFQGQDKAWNAFDLGLVSLDLVQLVMKLLEEFLPAGASLDGMNVGWLRLLRLLKMLKMLRMVKMMQFFKELRLLTTALAQAFKTLTWLLLMLFLIFFICGLCFVQGITQYVQDYSDIAGGMPEEVLVSVLRDWRSVGGATHTLFTVITAGRAWVDITEPLWRAGRIYYFLFLAYVAFMYFAVLNVFNGIFVQQCLNCANEDTESIINERMMRDRKRLDILREVFSDLDQTNSGIITARDFKQALKIHETIINLDAMDIASDDAKRVFNMLRRGGNHVSIDDFLHGCVVMKGNAKAIDSVCILSEMKKQEKTLYSFMRYCEENFNSHWMAMEKMGAKVTKPLSLSAFVDDV